MDPGEEQAFLVALTEDENLWASYIELQETVDGLEETSYDPSQLSCSRVMQFVHQQDEEMLAEAITEPTRKKLKYQFAASIAMIFLTFITIGAGLHGYKASHKEVVLPPDIPQLQWENSMLTKRFERARMNLNNLNGERESVLPVYRNTYKVVNTSTFPSPTNIPSQIVLLDLR